MISNIRTEIHDKCLDFRALDRLVQTPEFEQAFLLDSQNVWLRFAMISGNVVAVEAWIKNTLIKEVGELSMRELRAKASSLGIRYYNLMTKDELIVAITQVNHDRRIEKIAV